MKEAVIVSVARTPVTKFRGEFAGISVPDLGALAVKAVVEKAGIAPESVDEVIFANLFGSDWGNAARVCWLAAGYPDSVPAVTVDRQCSSSANAVGLAASLIQAGVADTVLAGGIESYSKQPYYIKRPESAYPAKLEFTDFKVSIPGGPGDNIPMIMTAENLAARYNISRRECDEFAVNSHRKAARAWAENRFAEQVFPVDVPQKKGAPLTVSKDSSVRADSTLEALAGLKPVLKPDGVVTAGNSSPQNDGAAAVLIMSREKAEAAGLKSLASIREYASAGCDPTIMGIGPVHSTRKLMRRFGYKIDDFDLVELNEAFAAQSIACIKELGLDMSRVNVDGGAIAIGHPNAASGGILTARLAYALKKRSLKRGLISFCCGGGQGFSLILENPEL
jgi:acetyl-CoA C-acetyltransferase